MEREKLYDALTQIDDEIIEEAGCDTKVKGHGSRSGNARRHVLKAWQVMTAAAAVVCIGIGALSVITITHKSGSAINSAMNDTYSMTTEVMPQQNGAGREPAEVQDEADMKNEAGVQSEAGMQNEGGMYGEAQMPDAVSEQKLIKNKHMTVETKEFDKLLEGIKERTEQLGGYIESSEQNGSRDRYSRNATFTLRIPAQKLNELTQTVGELSVIVYESESTDDVTLTYSDTESYLKALRTEHEALLALLEKADKLSDIMTIQSQITNVRYRIESYEARLKKLDNKVTYSTVYLNVREVQRETQAASQGFFSEAASRFSDNIYGIGQFLRNAGIWLIGSIPYLLIIAVAAGAVILIVRRIKKSR